MTNTYNPEYYAGYKPTKLKVNNLGINISDELNTNLNIRSSEYLIVGEQSNIIVSQNDSVNNKIGLIVDSEGLAINCSLNQRRLFDNANALQVEGNTYINGNVIITGAIQTSTGALIGSNSGSTYNFWKYAGLNSIYYEGTTTLGSLASSTSNNYTLNISESANYNINKAQFAIQNDNRSLLRMSILGEASNSPAIVNTHSNTPIEFHIGRNQDYFSNIYTIPNTEEGETRVNYNIPNYGGETDLGFYPNPNSSNYPHLNIDSNGNVGIKTNLNKAITFNTRTLSPSDPEAVIYTNNFKSSDLHVEGTTYSTNILIYDYESGIPKNIDELYIRKLGASIYACNIIPGDFAKGNFTFTSNVSINGQANNDIALKIYGDSEITKNLKVNCNIETDTFKVNNNGEFANSIYVDQDIRFKGDLKKYIFNESTGSNEWITINVTENALTVPSLSNIYYKQNVIVTTERFGIGIRVNNRVINPQDQTQHQLTVIKKDPTIFELELSDKSVNNFHKIAFIGHPPTELTGNFASDASLVFLTPHNWNDNYGTKYLGRSRQNIYFYSGWKNEKRISEFIINSENVPTFGVFDNNRVGVNTFYPTHELDVNGDIGITGNFYFKRAGDLTSRKIGIWEEQQYSTGTSIPPTFKGLQYINSESPHVGINTIPSNNYGLIVKGKIASLDGYYTSDGSRILSFYDSTLLNGILPLDYQRFTMNGRIGIGIATPESTFQIRDTRFETRLKLSESTASYNTSLQFNGNTTNYTLNLNGDYKTFGLYHGNYSNISNMTLKQPFVCKFNEETNTHQFIINSNLSFASNKPPDTALLVNGNVEIEGNVNISGDYTVNGSIYFSAQQSGNSSFLNSTNVQENNIFMAGNNIFLNAKNSSPTQISAVYIGWGGETSVDFVNNNIKATEAALYVRQTNTLSTYITKYKTLNPYCFSEYTNSLNRSMIIGLTPQHSLYIGKNTSNSFLTVSEIDNSGTSIGIGTMNTNSSKMHVYSDIFGQPMAHFTKYSGVADTIGLVSEITLEKLVNTNEAYSWKIQGPNFAYDQKLQFIYNENANSKEIVCITKNGCIGIGNPNPEYAIDILSENENKGSIRMIQTSTTASPQLIFQSGAAGSEGYGSDSYTDYRIYTFNNTFTLESQRTYLEEENNTNGAKTLLNFGSNNALGIGMLANSEYDVSIKGTLNVSSNIYINNRSFFSISDTSQGGDVNIFSGKHIAFIPDVPKFGSVLINSIIPTGNVFEVQNANNGNLAVFNSVLPTSYIHIKNKYVDAVDSIEYVNTFRIGSTSESIIFEVRKYLPLSIPPNNTIDSNNIYSNNNPELFIDDSSEYYNRISEFIPDPSHQNEFIQTIQGSLALNGISPTITMNTTNYFGTTASDNMYINTNNLGIGTITPNSKVHIYNDSEVCGLFIEQQNTSGLCNIVSIKNEDVIDKFVITGIGNVGICTASPNAQFEVIGKTIINNSNQNVALAVYGNTTISSNIVIGNNITIGGNGLIIGNYQIKGTLINDSDRNIKNDIIKIENALSKIEQISGYTYYKNDISKRETGVIAQEVGEVLPEAVYKSEDGVLGVAYANMVGLLIEGIKELSAELKEIKSKLADR
jgi:hypothetical protein